MKKQIVLCSVILMVILLAVFLVAGYGCRVKTYTDAEETISTKVNQEFAIALESTPRLGTNWYETHDDEMLTLVESSFVAKDKLRPVSGTRYFHFKALKAGETEITVTYQHGTTGLVREQKVFNVDIK